MARKQQASQPTESETTAQRCRPQSPKVPCLKEERRRGWGGRRCSSAVSTLKANTVRRRQAEFLWGPVSDAPPSQTRSENQTEFQLPPERDKSPLAPALAAATAHSYTKTKARRAENQTPPGLPHSLAETHEAQRRLTVPSARRGDLQTEMTHAEPERQQRRHRPRQTRPRL